MDAGSAPGSAAQTKPFDVFAAWRGRPFDWGQIVAKQALWPGMQLAQQAFDYWVDACQRSVLFLDVLRQRGNDHLEHIAQQVPHVLDFQFEPVMSGRSLARPVNYGLVRILPPPGVTIDPRKRPFIVFDPRAGHGPGIGGMKQDSEIGVALTAGHPAYFVGFTPDPVPGQTIEDVCNAEAQFVQKVIELHPEAEGKPCLIANCQAGWQVMMMSATRHDLVGPIMLAGTPLSYWAGVHGKNPLRYLGGLLGGTWLTSLAGDLGHGIFDGAYLVENFESLNPANTYWEKLYNLYAKIDTEPPRFLEFEKWWGSPVLLNAEEMQFIADQLFVGNKLSTGEIYTSDSVRIDLRNIKSPIIVFCSWGDNITPPQQALDWILDLYGSEKEITASGQTIIYALHQTIGHLGIFVSAKVATKEHEEFAYAMDLIDVLPPGLYEAVFTEKGAGVAHSELAAGDYVVRFEARTLSHIRALGGNDAADDQRFATVARVSEINQGLYRTFVSPLLRSCTSDQTAEWLRCMHPHRVRFEAFSDRNRAARPIAQLAEAVRANRRPVADDNPFLVLQKQVSQQIVEALDTYQEVRDRSLEALFMAIYASPLLQAMVGMRSDATVALRRIGRDVAREAAQEKTLAELAAHVEHGGMREAAIRALVYIGLGRPQQMVDERGFGVLREFWAGRPEKDRMSVFKAVLREQFVIVLLDEKAAIAALPKLLSADATERATALDLIRRVTSAPGAPTGEVERRLARIEAIFEAGPEAGVGPGEAKPKLAAARGPASSKRERRQGAAKRRAKSTRERAV